MADLERDLHALAGSIEWPATPRFATTRAGPAPPLRRVPRWLLAAAAVIVVAVLVLAASLQALRSPDIFPLSEWLTRSSANDTRRQPGQNQVTLAPRESRPLATATSAPLRSGATELRARDLRETISRPSPR